SKKRVSQVRSPGDVLSQALQEVGHHRSRLDARVPVLSLDGLLELVSLQFLVFLKPLLSLDDLEWISGRYQRLAEELIRVEGDGRHESVDLICVELRGALLGSALASRRRALRSRRRAPRRRRLRCGLRPRRLGGLRIHHRGYQAQ